MGAGSQCHCPPGNKEREREEGSGGDTKKDRKEKREFDGSCHQAALWESNIHPACFYSVPVAV